MVQTSLIRDLVRNTDPILSEEMPKYDFADDDAIPHATELAHTLAQSCIHHDGLGLSANQLGLRVRAFIMTATPMICMFNPVIVGESEATTTDDEGCLSYPGLILKIKRFDVIRVRYAKPNADIVTERYEGMTARIIQHEVDHLNGILFPDKVSKLKMEILRKKMKKGK
jgi:peptide deformylase